MGRPPVCTETKQGMRFLGSHFVLGEGARTLEYAKRYYKSFSNSIDEIGKAAGNGKLPELMGISVKLSALHLRYLATHHEQVMR